MTPETGRKIDELDGWRGLAILGVLIDHFFTADVLNLGRFGVELFFVLSGRLMAEILFVRRVSLRVFVTRRISRVGPALFCFATVLFVVAQLFQPFDISPSVYLAAIGFTMNYTAIIWDVSPAIDHLWSLAIEEHCYLVLAALAGVSRLWPGFPVRAALLALIVAAVLNGAAQTVLLEQHYHNVYWRTDVRGASILIGVVVYLWWRGDGVRPRPLAGSAIPLIAVLLGLALNLNVVPDPVKYSVGTACLAVAVTTLQQVPARVRAVLNSRVLSLLGVGSFSLYLWQQPFSLLENPLLRYGSFAAIGLLATISYRYVEQPARRALNRWLTPDPIRTAPARIAIATGTEDR